MDWEYDVENAPLGMGLLVWTSSRVACLSCALEPEGVFYGVKDPRQKFKRMWRDYPDRLSRAHKVLCYLIPDLPEPEKFKSPDKEKVKG